MAVSVLLAGTVTSSAAQEMGRARARDHGVEPGILSPGPNNAITDVEGVRVGHATVRDGTRINTGVTAILPHHGNLFADRPPAAIFVANGFGKLTGISQVQELGTLETPIILTGTLSVPRAADALLSYMLELPGNEDVRSINPVVGETNDGFLSDIRARPIDAGHVEHAIMNAASGAVPEGSVGAGTGTTAFGFKGGIGTSSRRLPDSLGGWTVGVLVQTNFGGILSIDGVPVGQELGRYYLRSRIEASDVDREPTDRAGDAPTTESRDGSCMIIVATDAPIDAANLERMALRGFMGMARTGAAGSNGSGDYVIAFSTNLGLRQGTLGRTYPRTSPLPTGSLSPVFLAAIEATEEAIYNSLFAANTDEGPRGAVEALDLERVREIMARYGRDD